MDSAHILAALRPVLGDERAAKLDRVAASRLSGLVVVLEHLSDPHNGGAAVRSCEAVGVLEMRVVGGPLKLSERVTQGCEKWLDLARDPDIDSCAASLKARGFRIYATVPGAKTPLEAIDPVAPAAFLVGNEHEGLTARARELADCEITLPLYGFSQSVNLSVATALTVYTHARRRREALGRSGDLEGAELDRLRARYYQRDIRGADAIVARFVPPEGAG
ncbi:MAG: TrmH family RNA methyltransferase [Polyangia bacterium]|jgi:tRNA (guanosine-2'-O-)-methyltransferase